MRESAPVRRVSLGDVVSSSGPSQLPKYLTAGINIGKSLGLRPTGNAIVTLGLSVLSDLASGMVQDPAYRSALQSFSDEMVDTLTPDLITSIKSDAVKIAEAMERDHTALMSREFFSKHMLKSSTDLKNELIASDDKAKQLQSSGHPRPSSPVYIESQARPLRIWG